MSQASNPTGIGLPAKIGAILFALWGVLHLWVGYEGVHQYLASGARGCGRCSPAAETPRMKCFNTPRMR